jgi:hypothetical protein
MFIGVTSCKCHTFAANQQHSTWLAGLIISFAKNSKIFSSKPRKLLKLLHGVNAPGMIMLTKVCTFHADQNPRLPTLKT